LYVRGQLIAYDSTNNYTTRFNQQELLTSSPLRANDYCDYVQQFHYHVNDTAGSEGTNPPCDGMSKTGIFESLIWPLQFTQKAVYLGTEHVNDMYCDHFFVRPLLDNGKNYQMDIWTSTGDQYPCQISIQDIPPPTQPFIITTWAFTGFKNTVPPQAIAGSFAKIQCTQKNWVCHARRNASSLDLQNALDYVCGGLVDCTPISPGGDHYYPNTVFDHCDWAFNNYWQNYKILQGYNACIFGGVAVLEPPTMTVASSPINVPIPQPPFFTRDLVCPSL